MKDKHFLDKLDDAEQRADEVAPDLGFPADGITASRSTKANHDSSTQKELKGI